MKMKNENYSLTPRTTAALQAERLVAIESRIKDDMNRFGEALLDIGRCLNMAKAEGLVPHGEWEAWVERHTTMNIRTAQRVMQAAREVPATSPLVRLSFSKVQTLLALPAAEREAFAEEVGADEMSVRELREAIKAKERAEQALADEQKRREEAEASLWSRDLNAADERRALLEEMAGLRDELETAQTNGAAQAQVDQMRAEIDRLQEELAEREDDVERFAALKSEAERKYLSLSAQVARGEAQGGRSKEFTPDVLREAVDAFAGRTSAFPYMRTELATCDYTTRERYRAEVKRVLDWCEASMRALDTIEGEVFDI